MAELKQSPLTEAAKEMGAVEVEPVPTYGLLSEVNLFLSVPKGHMKRFCEPGLEVETFVLMKTEAEQAGLVLEGAAYAPTPYNTLAAPPNVTEATPQGPVCPFHHKAKAGKGGYFCPSKLPNGNWCDWKSDGSEEEHLCGNHQTPFERHEKGNSLWYSHKLPDGTWCNE